MRRRCGGFAGMQCEAVVRLWMLRMLVPLGGHTEFVTFRGFRDDALAHALGLGHWVDPEDRDFEPKAVRIELRKLHQKAETMHAKAELPLALRHNLQQLAELVGLSAVDCQVLAFAIFIHSDRSLDDAGDWLGQLNSNKAVHVLAVLLGLDEVAVRVALDVQGVLAESGLMSLDRSGANALRGKLNVLSDTFADLMLSSASEPVVLLKGTVSAAPAGELQLTDYAHIQPSLDIALPYLRHALATQRQGVNIFLHGVPGTGKSQLARVLASALGSELFEVASENVEGEAVSGEKRLRAFRAAQSFFSRRQALVVFDEAEDVFNDGEGLFGRKSTAQLRKAWLNRMLEANPVPTIWLSNTVQGLDPAFIRRFDMVFELPVPPKKQRQRLLQAVCGDLLAPQQLARIAEVDVLAPAVVAKASSVVRAIQTELGKTQSGAAFERLVSNTLQAQGHAGLGSQPASALPDLYEPSTVHADVDLSALANGLQGVGSARLCLFGPPGTGKTAYGRWLAQRLDRPLVLKRASDLLAPYVGKSEQNIARAFQEAEQSGAVLLLDEVDSFLQARREGQRTWEVSLVNEMLTQMEAFSGLFIASTNWMGALDPAALRRFDLKVKFSHLKPEQAWLLFRRHCVALSLPAPRGAVRARLAKLSVLTPGDFAAVARQHRFRPLKNADALLQQLEAECALKPDSPRHAVGFV